MPKWEDIRDDLFQAYIMATGPITPDQQASMEDFMQSRGHQMKWNAIRYVAINSGRQFSRFATRTRRHQTGSDPTTADPEPAVV